MGVRAGALLSSTTRGSGGPRELPLAAALREHAGEVHTLRVIGVELRREFRFVERLLSRAGFDRLESLAPSFEQTGSFRSDWVHHALHAAGRLSTLASVTLTLPSRKPFRGWRWWPGAVNPATSQADALFGPLYDCLTRLTALEFHGNGYLWPGFNPNWLDPCTALRSLTLLGAPLPHLPASCSALTRLVLLRPRDLPPAEATPRLAHVLDVVIEQEELDRDIVDTLVGRLRGATSIMHTTRDGVLPAGFASARSLRSLSWTQAGPPEDASLHLVALARLRTLVLDQANTPIEFPAFGPNCAPNLASIIVRRGRGSMDVHQLACWLAGSLRTFVLQGVTLTCERYPLDASRATGDNAADAALAEAVAAWMATRVERSKALRAFQEARVVTYFDKLRASHWPNVPEAIHEAVKVSAAREKRAVKAEAAAAARAQVAAAAVVARDIVQAMPVLEKFVNNEYTHKPTKVVVDALAAAVATRRRDGAPRG